MVRYTFPSAASEWSVDDNGDIIIETPRSHTRIELTPNDVAIIADILLARLVEWDMPMPVELVGHIDTMPVPMPGQILAKGYGETSWSDITPDSAA